MNKSRFVVSAQAAVAICVSASAALGQTAPANMADAIDWRSIGPANMGGRITSLAVYEADPTIWYAATSSAGLLKTVNNGTTFEHQFEFESTAAIGAVAVAATDPDIVWVGTGENNPRNSVTWGDGVYKSTDGGETWEHMGLRETFATGDIIIHPEDPDVVFVGAMGRIWGENEQRGLFKTTDGGETWEKVLYVDATTGVIDMAMDPHDPDVILAAMWERQRDEFDTNDPAKRYGEGSGLYRTTDGGETWDEVTEGLPTVLKGRMGIDWSRSEEDTVYILVDSDRIGEGPSNPGYAGITGTDAEVGARISSVVDEGPAMEAGLQENDIVVEIDGENVADYDTLVSEISFRAPETEATLTVLRDGDFVELEITLAEHPDQDRKPFTQDLGGQRANIMDRQGEDGFETGGLYRSGDGGESWERVNSINPRPMYFSVFRVDPSDPSYQWVLGVVLQKSEDEGVTYTRDGGPGVHADHHAMWINPADGRHIILGCDGGIYVTYDRGKHWEHINNVALGQFYHVTTDNQPLYNVYGGLQDNGSWGAPNRTRHGRGPDNTDWFRIGGGDGFICFVDPEDPDELYMSSQNGGLARYNIRTGERGFLRPRAPRGTSYRFNWKTPYALSHHNHRIYYTAGNYVFRSFDRGNDLKAISPEITRTDRGTATAFAESPRDRDVMYVGTDDGSMWATADGGAEWYNIVYPYEAPEEEAEEGAESADEAEAPESEPETDEPQADERPAGRRGAGGPGGGDPEARMAAVFEQMDGNGDGKLSTDEIPDRMRQFIGSADSNGDGSISQAELSTAFSRMRGAAGGRGGPGAEGGEGRRREAGARATARQEGRERPAGREGGRRSQAEAREAQADDPIVGEWLLTTVSEQGESEVTITMTRLEDGALEAQISSQFLDETTKDVTFDAESGRLNIAFSTDFGDATGSGTVDGNSLTGSFVFGEGQFVVEFSGQRQAAADEGGTDGPTLDTLIPGPGRFSSIEASRFADGRVFATIDRHYYDDTKAYVVMSDDHGKTWKSLSDGLPDGSARAVREDLQNPDVLYLGTEFALWASVDRGDSWFKINNNLPTVAIHDIAQHSGSNEIVAGTHGRSLWAADISPIRGMNARALSTPAYLLEPHDVVRWHSMPGTGQVSGARWYEGDNGPDGVQICYLINERVNSVSLKVYDVQGRMVKEFEGLEPEQGLNSVRWDLRSDPPSGGQGGRFRRGRPMPLGDYRVELVADGMAMSQTFSVRPDPDFE